MAGEIFWLKLPNIFAAYDEMLSTGLWRYVRQAKSTEIEIRDPTELLEMFNPPAMAGPSRRVGLSLVSSERVEDRSDYINQIQFSIDSGDT